MTQDNVLRRYQSLMQRLDESMRATLPLENPFKVGDYVSIPEGAEYSREDTVSYWDGHRTTTEYQEVEIVDVVTLTKVTKAGQQHSIVFEDENEERRVVLLSRAILDANGK